MIAQLIVNIILSATIYLLVATSFILIYYSTKFFNITHAAIILIAPYLLHLCYVSFAINIIVSLFLSLICTMFLGICTELFIFRPLRFKKSTNLILLIASIGVYIIVQNLISLFWGDEVISLNLYKVQAGKEIMGAYLTDIQLITIISGIILFMSVIILLNITKLGIQIRAVSSNEDLSKIYGVNSNRVIFWTFAIGSSLAAVIGILVAVDIELTPSMGFNLLLYGIVAMIIGGVNSIWGLVGGSLLLATAQHLGAYYMDTKWIDAIAYIILILFLIWKPLGFSRKQLKKVEI